MDSDTSSLVLGPLHRPQNPHAESAGSIHDDRVARGLGFRGGTVAGDVLMDSFPPLLVEHFGDEWLRSGSLSLYFRQAIEGGDEVQAGIVPVGKDEVAQRRNVQTRVVLQRPDGRRICEGTASIGEPEAPTELHGRDLRPVEPEHLRILGDLRIGEDVPSKEIEPTRESQLDRKKRGYQTLALPCYESKPAIGAPSTLVGELLYRYPRRYLTPRIGEAVGLFGAIEIRHWNGPVELDRRYRVSAKIAALGDSPKTEVLWFDSEATDLEGQKVATMRMMLRFMKASSPLYAEPGPLSTAAHAR